MLQAAINAHRSAIDCVEATAASSSAQRSAFQPLVSRLMAFGRTLLSGRTEVPLSDHLLDDIGLSRADLDAMEP